MPNVNPELLNKFDTEITKVVFDSQTRIYKSSETALTPEQIEMINASSASDLAALREMMANL